MWAYSMGSGRDEFQMGAYDEGDMRVSADAKAYTQQHFTDTDTDRGND